jgi:hypothetical protein
MSASGASGNSRSERRLHSAYSADCAGPSDLQVMCCNGVPEAALSSSPPDHGRPPPYDAEDGAAIPADPAKRLEGRLGRAPARMSEVAASSWFGYITRSHLASVESVETVP